MTDAEHEEVAQIITQALMSFGGGGRDARGRHIVQELETQGWILLKETDG